MPAVLTKDLTDKIRAIIHSDVKCFRRRVLSNPAVSVERRLSLAHSLVLSRGLFQSSAWAVVDGTPLRRLHAALMSVYRCIAGAKWTPDQTHASMSDDQVLDAVQAPSVFVLLRRARIMAFIRLVSNGSSHLMKLLFAARATRGSWVRAVTVDMSWFAAVARDLGMDSCSSLASWASLIQCDRGLVRCALFWAVRTWSLLSQSPAC